ncbi:MAG: hypothetical protein Q4G68_05745 [Planctomycetia bacterium]|nr:hypothetical protein [Planctomycetia bacterium]
MSNDPFKNSFDSFSGSESFGSPDQSFNTGDAFSEATRKNHLSALPFALLGGLITSALVLLIVFLCARRFETDLLSLLLGPLPVGAILLGGLAGCGYAIVCRCCHFRLAVGWILLVFLLQAGLFLGGRYLEYLSFRNDFNKVAQTVLTQLQQMENAPLAEMENLTPATDENAAADDAAAQDNAPAEDAVAEDDVFSAPSGVAQGEPAADRPSADAEIAINDDEFLVFGIPTFWEYYKGSLESTALGEIGEEQDPDEALGSFGYLFEACIMLSFCLASIVGLMIVYSQPYCDTCGRYLHKSRSFLVPARIPYEKIKKKDLVARAEFDRLDCECLHQALDRFEQIADLVTDTASRPAATCEELDRALADWEDEGIILLKDCRQYANWLLVDWHTCNQCDNWHLQISIQMSPDSHIPNRIRGKCLLKAGRDQVVKRDSVDTTTVDNVAAKSSLALATSAKKDAASESDDARFQA